MQTRNGKFGVYENEDLFVFVKFFIFDGFSAARHS